MRHLRRLVLPAIALTFGLAALPAFAADKGFSLGRYWLEVKTWFMAGGNSMWFILLCSILAIAFTFERLIRLQRRRLIPRTLAARARELYRQGRFGEIIALCDADNSMLARVIKTMVLHRNVPVGDLRSLIADSMSSEMRLHFRRVHPMAVAATVGPLLGLFGTISGMVGAFNKFSLLGETGDPTVFAADISLALITTEAGLMVAIPSLSLWHWFRNRTNAFADELEGVVQELLIDWFIRPATQGQPA